MASGNDSNGVPVVTPQQIEEPETGLVPQEPRPLARDLFGDQRIFVNAPQYHWHVQGAVAADDEARQQIVALAQQVYQFGHRTEERELEIWRRLGGTAEIVEVHQLLANLDKRMQDETTKFATDLTGTVKRELEGFGRTISVLGDQIRHTERITIHDLKRSNAELTARVERSEQQAQTTCTQLKTDLELEFRKNDEALKALINREVEALKARMEGQLNEVRSELNKALQGIKDQVTEVQESQQTMRDVLDKLSKDLHELRMNEDAEGEEESVTSDPLREETAHDAELDFGTTPIDVGAAGPTPRFFSADVGSVKDSVTSGLPAEKPYEALGSIHSTEHSGVPVMKGMVRVDTEEEDDKEEILLGKQTKNMQKGKFTLDPMMKTAAPHVDYSASVDKGIGISLVGKSSGPTPGGSMLSLPQTAGVGQMKLEAPPRYSGKRQPGVRVWLAQMQRYMRLMRYDPSDWLDVVAMRVDGAASSWVNAVLQDIAEGNRQIFRTWAQFKEAMIQRFEPVTETEEARKQLKALRQTGRVAGYIQRFQELQFRLPGMTEEEAFYSFVSGLQPHIQEQVGAHVQGDLEAAIAMAQRLEVYRGGEGSKSGNGGKGSRKQKMQKKGQIAQVEGSSGGTVLVVQQQTKEKGKGGQGKGKKKSKRGGKKKIQCHCCGGPHFMRDCEKWQKAMKKLTSSEN